MNAEKFCCTIPCEEQFPVSRARRFLLESSAREGPLRRDSFGAPPPLRIYWKTVADRKMIEQE